MAPELTNEAWAQIRYDYEHTDRPIDDICAEHGISSGTLRDRVRRWRWTRRRLPIPFEGPPPVPRVDVASFTAAQAFDVAAPLPTTSAPSSTASGGEPGKGGAPDAA